MAFFFLTYFQLKSPNQFFLLLLTVFFIYSIGLITGPKCLRYGYLIPFFYLMFTAFALRGLYDSNRLLNFRIIMGLFVLIPILFSSSIYMVKLERIERANVAFEKVKIEPYLWLKNHIKPGAKIAQTDVYFSPPLPEHTFDCSPNFLAMPWGSSNEMITKAPPNYGQLFQLADVILLSNEDKRRRDFIEPLVRAKYDLQKDSIIFCRYTNHLTQIFPNINNGITPKEFFTKILSIMWNKNITFEAAIKIYFKLNFNEWFETEKLLHWTIDDLFSGNEHLLGLKYSEFIRLTGGIMVIYAWDQFYEDLSNVFYYKKFEYSYEYSSVKQQNIYVINKNILLAGNSL